MRLLLIEQTKQKYDAIEGEEKNRERQRFRSLFGW